MTPRSAWLSGVFLLLASGAAAQEQPSQHAMPIGSSADWLTPQSYPAAAMRMGEQGVVGFELTIDPDGHVADCTVTRPSGSASLDAATCSIAKRKPFHPATDAQGKPVSDTYTSSIRWTMP